MLKLRNNMMQTIADVELVGPLNGYYSMEYVFEEPIRADSIREAVLINNTEDPVTLTWLQVVGLMECWTWTYIDHSCPGLVLGPGGCPRMVLF